MCRLIEMRYGITKVLKASTIPAAENSRIEKSSICEVLYKYKIIFELEFRFNIVMYPSNEPSVYVAPSGFYLKQKKKKDRCIFLFIWLVLVTDKYPECKRKGFYKIFLIAKEKEE